MEHPSWTKKKELKCIIPEDRITVKLFIRYALDFGVIFTFYFIPTVQMDMKEFLNKRSKLCGWNATQKVISGFRLAKFALHANLIKYGK